MPDLVRVADYKKRDAYHYARAIDSSFIHLSLVKHMTLCLRTVSTDDRPMGDEAKMCPKCVGKAGTRTLTLRRRT